VSTPNYDWLHIADASRTGELAVGDASDDTDALPYAVVALVFMLFTLVVVALVLR
jgi:hypothetical protein